MNAGITIVMLLSLVSGGFVLFAIFMAIYCWARDYGARDSAPHRVADPDRVAPATGQQTRPLSSPQQKTGMADQPAHRRGIYVQINPPGAKEGPYSVFVPEGTNPQEAIERFLDILPVELGGRFVGEPTTGERRCDRIPHRCRPLPNAARARRREGEAVLKTMLAALALVAVTSPAGAQNWSTAEPLDNVCRQAPDGTECEA